MYEIVVCEDEKQDLETVRRMLDLYGTQRGWKYRLKAFSSAEAFMETMRRPIYDPDVVLLDIYLQEENGMEIAEHLRNSGFTKPIVFLTASREHALEAYNVDAAQYLVKPLEEKRFFSMLDRLFAKTEEPEPWMVLRVGGEFRRVPLDKIVYCEAQRNYQYIYMEDRSKYKVRMTMTELYSRLERFAEFAKVGSAYIFNLAFIESLNAKTATFSTGTAIHLPRGSYSSLKEEYFQYYCGD